MEDDDGGQQRHRGDGVERQPHVLQADRVVCLATGASGVAL